MISFKITREMHVNINRKRRKLHEGFGGFIVGSLSTLGTYSSLEHFQETFGLTGIVDSLQKDKYPSCKSTPNEILAVYIGQNQRILFTVSKNMLEHNLCIL